ncbi:hypothetical protein GE061_014601 [Apolygus lucorum]|uniref:Uncharacterized protein n=1 Tax=Apolygus lucorum TaxID=248454 RepID=A0A8S9XJU4_APOLU|nr:hypothetical protein GE061_014601 [Apolygus lucorum]
MLSILVVTWFAVAFCSAERFARNSVLLQPSSSFEVKKVLEEHCRTEYSATCLKADVAALVAPISVPRSFRLLPGLVLEMGGFPSSMPRPPSDDVEVIDRTLNRYLVKGMDGFINSLALRVKVMDRSVADVVRNMGIALGQESQTLDANSTLPRADFTGRRRKLNQALMMGGMVSAGTLLALTMSAVSAMAGKAVLVSLLSLALTLLNGRGGGGSSSGGKVSYEIVHTVPQHDDIFTKAWANTDPIGEATHHFIKPIVSHLGGRRAGQTDIHV